MAKMYPEKIESYNPTYSELKVFKILKEQLSDDCSVYYSVSWVLNKYNSRENSEVDFLIFDPRFGYMCIEVKGGQGISVRDGVWYLKENGGERQLKRSPYEQAEASMYYFLSLYSETYNYNFKGVFGSMVIFPTFEFPSEIGHRPSELTVSSNELNMLGEKIKKAFIFWRSKNTGVVTLSQEQQANFLQLVQTRLAIGASAGSLIEYKTEQLNTINRVQDNIIYLLKNHNQFYIKGGAGTGKTWIGIKIATQYAKDNRKTLFICYSKNLSLYLKTLINNENIQVTDLLSFAENNNLQISDIDASIKKIEGDFSLRYDAIVVDEAQDFNEEWAYLVRSMLVNDKNSALIVLFDDTQNVYQRDFGDSFMIPMKPFLLRENLRNTSSIYNWATRKSSLGMDVITNPIEGPEPLTRIFNDKDSFYRYIEILINDLTVNEKVELSSIVILIDDSIKSKIQLELVTCCSFSDSVTNSTLIRVFSSTDFKGLESDVVIYVHKKDSCDIFDYVAYTRARFYLYDFIINFQF